MSQDMLAKLALGKPWKIQRVREDSENLRLIVDLAVEGRKKSWFSFDRDVTCPVCANTSTVTTTTKVFSIRHINVDGYEVYLRAPQLPVSCGHINADCPLRLSGSSNLPYSRLMEQAIRRFWEVPDGAVVAAKALRLSPEEVKQLANAGWLPRSNELPPPTHPVWLDIVTKRIPLETRNLGLQCLLTWANGQLQRNGVTETDRLAKIAMVRSYFEKYRHTLQYELDQLLNKWVAS